MNRHTRSALRAIAALSVGMSACSEAAAPEAESLTIFGAATAPPPAGSVLSARGSASPASADSTGDPATMVIGVYALYISPNVDCSAPVLVQDYGEEIRYRDLVQNPVLFEGTPPDGRYPCVMFRMSDILRMEPATSFGPCVAGQEYSGDIYRDGETDWVDMNLDPIVGRGSDEQPVDDRVTVFLTRDTEAAVARGVSPNQVVGLESDLVVPGQSTLYWDGTGSVAIEEGSCSLVPGAVGFR